MEKEVLDRIAALEREVKELRVELHILKQDQVMKPERPVEKEHTLKKYLALDREQPQQKVRVAVQPKPVRREPEQLEPAKPKRSLEEMFMLALPKVFMIILVLGVLWGLKLVSDYGYLSDGIKIVLSYVLSIGLGIYGFIMESKNIGSRAVAIALYGGAFIVGILTTAAGAIMYDVLGLYTALVVALIYIVYGVAISYVKGNEVLTTLVVFTSLLLPYLLEYMDFSGVLIAAFIVLLFAVVQLVIWKHRQRKALYVGAFLSLLAVCIVAAFHTGNELIFAGSGLVLYCIFLASYLPLYDNSAKTKNVHAGLLFGMTMFVIFMINTVLAWQDPSIMLVSAVLLIVLVVVAYRMYKDSYHAVFDVLATVSVMVVLNIIIHLNVTEALELLMFMIATFAGLVLALKLHIPFMKWLYSIVFAITLWVVWISNTVKPFLSIEHMMLLLAIAMLVFLYGWLLRLQVADVTELDEEIGTFTFELRLQDWFPVIIYGAVLSYVYKMDMAYVAEGFTGYMFLAVVPIVFAGVLLLTTQQVGRFLPVVGGVVYAIAGLVLYGEMWNMAAEVAISLWMRIVYLLIFIAILVDIWLEGRIYKNYKEYVKAFVEHIFVVGMLLIVLAIFGITSFAHNYSYIGWSTAVITNTISIFVVASLALLLATKRDYKNLKLTGIALLFFGIVKMIFFDLSALDLLIRSILFIGIGAVGLVVSNKLLGNKKMNSWPKKG